MISQRQFSGGKFRDSLFEGRVHSSGRLTVSASKSPVFLLKVSALSVTGFDLVTVWSLVSVTLFLGYDVSAQCTWLWQAKIYYVTISKHVVKKDTMRFSISFRGSDAILSLLDHICWAKWGCVDIRGQKYHFKMYHLMLQTCIWWKQCWATVCEAGPTLFQHQIHDSYLNGPTEIFNRIFMFCVYKISNFIK